MIRLAPREKKIAIGLGVFAALWSFYAVAVSPALNRIETLNRVIGEKQQELEKIRAISREYVFFNRNPDTLHTQLDSAQDTFQLLPYLEALIDECGMAKNFETVKRQVLPIDSNYSEIVVEVRLNNLSISQLVNFLGKIESSKTIARTKSLYVRRNMVNKNLLDSVIEIHNTEYSRNEHARL
ncbi:MAG: type II secretion system protein M [Sedimentisphaerales bacterium]|nr:type II secretion system protein M [Sedimentisphaerales bacterium]